MFKKNRFVVDVGVAPRTWAGFLRSEAYLNVVVRVWRRSEAVIVCERIYRGWRMSYYEVSFNLLVFDRKNRTFMNIYR